MRFVLCLLACLCVNFAQAQTLIPVPITVEVETTVIAPAIELTIVPEVTTNTKPCVGCGSTTSQLDPGARPDTSRGSISRIREQRRFDRSEARNARGGIFFRFFQRLRDRRGI